jgi:hypothetical protein
MTIEDRLARLEKRQKALVSAIHRLTDVQESSDLSDLIKALTVAVQRQGEHMQTMTGILVKLPEQVARAVSTGAR